MEEEAQDEIPPARRRCRLHGDEGGEGEMKLHCGPVRRSTTATCASPWRSAPLRRRRFVSNCSCGGTRAGSGPGAAAAQGQARDRELRRPRTCGNRTVRQTVVWKCRIRPGGERSASVGTEFGGGARTGPRWGAMMAVHVWEQDSATSAGRRHGEGCSLHWRKNLPEEERGSSQADDMGPT